MVSLTLSRPVVWGIIIFLGLAVLLPSQELPAQEGCTAVDRYDMPRNCTFLEEHGECLWNALDSFDTCIEASKSFWGTAGCWIGVEVDIFACNLAMPGELIRSIVR